jgi:hypothetical protein
MICLVLAAMVGCTSKKEAESQASDAYEQGLKEGQSKGYEIGQADGYKTGYDKGYNEGYDEGYDETQQPKVEVKHGYKEETHPVTCPNCGGDGFIDGISKKEICPTCKMSGVIQVTEREYY